MSQDGKHTCAHARGKLCTLLPEDFSGKRTNRGCQSPADRFILSLANLSLAELTLNYTECLCQPARITSLEASIRKRSLFECVAKQTNMCELSTTLTVASVIVHDMEAQYGRRKTVLYTKCEHQHINSQSHHTR